MKGDKSRHLQNEQQMRSLFCLCMESIDSLSIVLEFLWISRQKSSREMKAADNSLIFDPGLHPLRLLNRKMLNQPAVIFKCV